MPNELGIEQLNRQAEGSKKEKNSRIDKLGED